MARAKGALVVPPKVDLGFIRSAVYADFERTVLAGAYKIEMRDGGGLRPAQLWPDQLLLTRALCRQRAEGQPMRGLVLKTRRAGMSTVSAMWTFHHSYFRDHQHAALIAHHQDTTSVLYNVYQTLYNELPDELKVPLEKLNRKELATVRPYSSTITATTAGFVEIGRGPTLQHAHLSEADYYADAATAMDGILNSVHLGADTSVIIESTSRGAGLWLHKFWNASKAGKTGFVTVFSPWFNVPEHKIRPPKDLVLSSELEKRMYEFNLSLDQMAWYVYKLNETIAKEPWGGERKMRQEHPFDEEEAFQSSGICVFPDIVLNRLRLDCMPPKIVRRLEHMPERGQVREVPAEYDPTHPLLTIWKQPEEGRFYALGVDLSDGVGETESVVTVCAYPGYEQVAEWASAQRSVEEVAYVARYLAERYGGSNSMIIPEINRNGSLILHILFNLPGNYQVFRWRYLDRPAVQGSDNPQLGWQTNQSSKKALVQVANMVFLRGEGIVRSEILHEQMRRCIEISAGERWQGEGGKSDRVIAWLIAMIGCYLDYEGGSVAGMVSDREAIVSNYGDNTGWREPNSYDSGVGELFAGRSLPIGSAFQREDVRDR